MLYSSVDSVGFQLLSETLSPNCECLNRSLDCLSCHVIVSFPLKCFNTEKIHLYHIPRLLFNAFAYGHFSVKTDCFQLAVTRVIRKLQKCGIILHRLGLSFLFLTTREKEPVKLGRLEPTINTPVLCRLHSPHVQKARRYCRRVTRH